MMLLFFAPLCRRVDQPLRPAVRIATTLGWWGAIRNLLNSWNVELGHGQAWGSACWDELVWYITAKIEGADMTATCKVWTVGFGSYLSHWRVHYEYPRTVMSAEPHIVSGKHVEPNRACWSARRRNPNRMPCPAVVCVMMPGSSRSANRPRKQN